ncbi:MAG: DUF2240 family protein [Promethearchaeota archaeon]
MSVMKTEVYINKIIEDTGLTRKEIQGMVKDKKVELKGLISEEGALFIIARELGVDVKDENRDLLKDIELNISDIKSTMKNITLIGRIKEVYSVNSFNRSDGETGYVGSFLLHDHTGDIRIVLWDDHVKIFNMDNFNVNEVIKIVNGIAKKGKYEQLEIHLGRFSKIIISPDDVDYNKYPKIKFEPINISEINLSLKSLSLEGKVIRKTQINEFARKNGDLGKVGSLTLLDTTGTARVTFWNEDTKKMNDIEVDDIVSITNLNPRLSNLDSKTIDLFVNKTSIIKKKSKKLSIEGKEIKSIKTLQNQKGIVKFRGIITSIDDLKAVTLKSGENTSLLGVVVSDNTDGIRVTLWGENAEEYSKKLATGKGLLLSNVLVKYSNFSKRNEISLISESKLELIDLKINNLKFMELSKKGLESSYSGNYKKIENINSPDRIEIKGYIAKDINNITTYEACTNCFKKVDNCTCGMRENTEYRMIINLIIDDGTGTIRTTFIGERAEKLIGIKTDKIVQIKDTPDFEKILEKKSSELLGKDIIIKGKAKFSDYSNSYEISVYDFKSLNIDEELEKVMKEIKL